MNALSPPMFALQHRELFERTVLRGVAAGAALGVLHQWGGGVLAGVPAWFVTAPAVLVALPGLGVWARAGFLLASLLGLAAVQVLVGSRVMAAAVVGVLVALGIYLAHWLGALDEKRASQPDGLQVAGAVIAGGVASVVVEAVLRVLALRFNGLAIPPLLGNVLLTGAGALFLALSALPLHLVLRPDPVEARAAELLSTTEEPFRQLSARALGLYRECVACLASLPRDAARAELSRTLVQLAKGAIEHGAEWSRVDRDLRSDGAHGDAGELERLREELASTTDDVTRRHLELAAESFAEEERRLASLRESRTRALARMTAEVALLAKTRGSLRSMRSGHAEIKSAELSALARRLSTIASTQSLEAEVMHEVAAGAERDQLAG